MVYRNDFRFVTGPENAIVMVDDLKMRFQFFFAILKKIDFDLQASFLKIFLRIRRRVNQANVYTYDIRPLRVHAPKARLVSRGRGARLRPARCAEERGVGRTRHVSLHIPRTRPLVIIGRGQLGRSSSIGTTKLLPTCFACPVSSSLVGYLPPRRAFRSAVGCTPGYLLFSLHTWPFSHISTVMCTSYALLSA